MRIVFLLGSAYGQGGAVRTTLSTAGALAERGHTVEIWSIVKRKQPNFPISPRIRVRFVAERPESALRTPRVVAMRGLHRILSRLPSRLFPDFDKMKDTVSLWTDVALWWRFRALDGGIVIGTHLGSNVAVARLAGPEVVAIGEEHLHLGRRPAAVRRVLQRPYRALDGFITLTESDAADYRKFLGPGPKVFAIPNAVPAQPAPTAAPAEARNPAVPLAIAAGRLMRQKGFDLLILAWRAVADRWPDWRLEIHGAGPEKEGLQALIGELGLGEQIRLMGFTRNLPARMAQASLFVLSSRFEGFPMVLLEAFGAGLPVVASNCPTGPSELIEDGVNGLLVTPESPDALAAAILRAIEDPQLRARMASAACRTADNYRLEAVADRWEAALSDLVAIRDSRGRARRLTNSR